MVSTEQMKTGEKERGGMHQQAWNHV